MPISITPGLKSDGTNLDHIISFHDTQDPFTFYQQINTTFMILLMSIHPDDLNGSVYSVFTPEAQFNGSISQSIKGRSKNSMHQHNCFEFTYVLQGNMYQIVEGKRYLYTPGSCCLMNRNTLHTEDTSTDFVCIFFSVSSDFVKRLKNYGNSMLFPQEQKRFDNLIFHFMEENMEENHKNTKDFLDFVPRITQTQQVIMVHDIFEKMLKTLLSPYYGATYRLQDLFFKLIDILCNPTYYNVMHVTTKSSMDSLLFARIGQLLEEHKGRISNKELARILNYDGTYLGKIVKKYTGQSLFDYSMNFTMRAAADMLSNTKKSVSGITAELQFTNRTHFYKIFQERYHMTPKEYRDCRQAHHRNC